MKITILPVYTYQNKKISPASTPLTPKNDENALNYKTTSFKGTWNCFKQNTDALNFQHARTENKYLYSESKKIISACKNTDGSINKTILALAKEIYKVEGKICPINPQILEKLILMSKDKNRKFQPEMLEAVLEYQKNNCMAQTELFIENALLIAKDSDGIFNTEVIKIAGELYFPLKDNEVITIKSCLQNKQGKFDKNSTQLLSSIFKNYKNKETLDYHIQDYCKIVSLCKNKKGKHSEEAIAFVEKAMRTINNDECFRFYTTSCLENSKDDQGNFKPEICKFLKHFKSDIQYDTPKRAAVSEIVQICNNQGNLDPKAADFALKLKKDGFSPQEILIVLKIVKGHSSFRFKEELANDFEAVKATYLRNQPKSGQKEHSRTVFEQCTKKNEQNINIWKEVRGFFNESINFTPAHILNMVPECLNYNKEINHAVLAKTKEYMKHLKDIKHTENLYIIPKCIKNAEENTIYPKNAAIIEKMINGGHTEILPGVLDVFYSENYGEFDIKGAEQFCELLDAAKKHKQELRSALDDLTDQKIDHFFLDNAYYIKDAARLAGTNALIDAFALKLDNFGTIAYEVGNLLDDLQCKNLLEPVLELTNPKESEKYQKLTKEINENKAIIRNSKTAAEKEIEDENNEKIAILNKEISALKQQLSVQKKQIPANNALQADLAPIKQKIKEKTDSIKELNAQTQDFLNKNTPNVKIAVNKANELRLERKKLLENAMSEPKDIIEKLIILETLFTVTFPTEIIKRMNTKTPQEKEEFNRFITEKLYSHLDCKYDKKTSERLKLEKSKYFGSLFMAQEDFIKSFKDLYELIRKNPYKSIGEIIDSLEQNIKTRRLFEENGINYARWTNVDKNSCLKATIQTDTECAQKAAVTNLENDFNDPIYLDIPENERKKLEKSLKNAGISLIGRTEIQYDDDGLPLGEKSIKRLYYDGEPIKFEKLGVVITKIKEVLNKEDFWNKQNPDARIENAKNTLLNHLLTLRTNDYKNAANLKSSRTVDIEVRQTDMNDISHALFLGNHAGCCTAVGTGVNEWSAPEYIMNRCISGIEVVNGDKFAGNTMCYLAKVDGKTALVLDNIELNTKYQFNNTIRDLIIEYAKKLAAEIGKPDMPIYAGPFRHKVHLEKFPYKQHNLEIIGSTGDRAVYIDYITDEMQIGKNKPDTVGLYSIA